MPRLNPAREGVQSRNEHRERFRGDVKATYILLETKRRRVETKRRRLGDVASGVETVLRGVEVILPIRRHRRSFRRAHSCTPYLTQPRPDISI